MSSSWFCILALQVALAFAQSGEDFVLEVLTDLKDKLSIAESTANVLSSQIAILEDIIKKGPPNDTSLNGPEKQGATPMEIIGNIEKAADDKLKKIIELLKTRIRMWQSNGSQPAANSCPPNVIGQSTVCNSTTNPIGCYCVIFQSSTWEQAADLCAQIGARLVSIETAAESVAIKELYSNLDNFDRNNGAGMRLWTSGSDKEQEDRWIWTSTGLEISEFTDWRPDEPSSGTFENYLDLWLESNLTGWNDSPNDPGEFGWEVLPLCEF